MANKLRKTLADRIYAVGGYSNRHERYPLEWTVGVYHSVPENKQELKEALQNSLTLQRLAEIIGKLTPEQMPILKRAIKQACKSFNPNHLWKYVLEDMQREIFDSDVIYYVSPDIEKRYGLPSGYKFNVEFALLGKHLCLAKFEGYNLRGISTDTMIEWLDCPDDLERGENFGNETVRPLLAYIDECNKMFSAKAIKASFDHTLAFLLAQHLDDEWKSATDHVEWKQQCKASKKRVRQNQTQPMIPIMASTII